MEEQHLSDNESLSDDDLESLDEDMFRDVFLQPEDSLNLELDLLEWAHECKVSHPVITALLKRLRKHGHTTLPKDGRTLLKTPQNIAHLIKSVEPGNYVRFMYLLYKIFFLFYSLVHIDSHRLIKRYSALIDKY